LEVSEINKKLVVGVITGIVLISLAIAFAVKPDPARNRVNGERIGVIYIEGIITGGRGEGGVFGVQASGPVILTHLRQAGEDDSIKAVLIRINSPGGSAAASQEIGDEIDKVRKEGKLVIASMGDVAASGGYWIAARADRIIANPATMTGSIGVIMETQDMQELFDKIGISPQTIKSGPHKDMGSPNRPLTTEERDILQDMVNDIYDQFVDVVADGRKMDRQKVMDLADGRIFTGRQAKENGLVDELGNYYDAVDLAARLAKIKGDPVIYEYGPKSAFERLFGGLSGLSGLNGRFSGISPGEIQGYLELLMTKREAPR